jgi:hypothetical protein
MPVAARRHVRKMRGGAQAHLIEAEDGHFYVVKFRNNPQHRRVLINEWIASVFLEFLQISAPPTQFVRLSEEFLLANPEAHLQLGSRRVEAAPGWHFGSRYPGDPARTAVYDFVPDALLEKVINLAEFLGVLVFDKWMGNADAIFFRARLRESQDARLGFLAQMIDHGFVFDGPHWTFTDASAQGLHLHHAVYRRARSFDDFQPWLDRVMNFPEDAVDRAVKQIPSDWFQDDEGELEKLLLRLLARRRRVPELIEGCRRDRVNLFPNWR